MADGPNTSGIHTCRSFPSPESGSDGTSYDSECRISMKSDKFSFSLYRCSNFVPSARVQGHAACSAASYRLTTYLVPLTPLVSSSKPRPMVSNPFPTTSILRGNLYFPFWTRVAKPGIAVIPPLAAKICRPKTAVDLISLGTSTSRPVTTCE